MALGVNVVMGQGIFLLPGVAAAMLGPAAIGALLLAALIACLIALCFAEVGARFRTTGGAYVYARETFGPFIGFEVGWMVCCVAVISWAALAIGFTEVVSTLVPAVGVGWLQSVVAIGLMLVLAGANMFGAKLGATISTVFSIAKLLPVALFIAVGLFHVRQDLFSPFAPHGYERLAETTLLLLYAFVGFESSVVPAGEMKNPQKAVPVALMGVMAALCLVYLAIFVIAMGTLPELAGHPNPVAAASEGFMGSAGGTLVAVGIVVSVFGINAACTLVAPRKVFAMAERGDLPAAFARVHAGTGVPRVAIGVALAVAAALSLTGTFKELAILGVVARFVQYIPTCIAVLVLRRRDPSAAGFRIPLGPVVPIAAVCLCAWLIVSTDPGKLLGGLAGLLLGVPFYLLARRRAAGRPT